jgi:hypothetical protein
MIYPRASHAHCCLFGSLSGWIFCLSDIYIHRWGELMFVPPHCGKSVFRRIDARAHIR